MRYGVGDAIQQPTPDLLKSSNDNVLPRQIFPGASGDGGSYIAEIVEEVEEAETEE